MPANDQIAQVALSDAQINAPTDNVTPPPPSPTSEKVSLAEFENYQPLGQKPIVNEDGKVLNDRNSDKRNNLPKPDISTTAEDTNLNTNKETNEPEETKEEVEDKTETEGEVKDGTQDTEGEVETPETSETPEEKEHGNTKRDYTGYPKELVKVLKRLDNPRFAAITTAVKPYIDAANKSIELAKQLVEKDRLLKEQGIPQQWQDHPEAYTLSKEYQKVASEYSRYDFAEQHYEQQIVKIRKGEPWQSLTFDSKGQPIYQQHEASDEALRYAEKNANVALHQKSSLDAKASTLKEQHIGSYQKATEQVKQEVDYMVSKIPAEFKPQKEDMEALDKVIPERFHNHPYHYAMQNLFGALKSAMRENAKLKALADNKNRIKQDINKAGPTPGKIRPSASGAKNGNDNMLRLKDFGD